MVSIDHHFYAHFIDDILSYTSTDVWKTFRATSHYFRDKIDELSVRYMFIGEELRSHNGIIKVKSDIPFDVRTLRLLQHTRILDVYCFSVHYFDIPSFEYIFQKMPPCLSILRMFASIKLIMPLAKVVLTMEQTYLDPHVEFHDKIVHYSNYVSVPVKSGALVTSKASPPPPAPRVREVVVMEMVPNSSEALARNTANLIHCGSSSRTRRGFGIVPTTVTVVAPQDYLLDSELLSSAASQECFVAVVKATVLARDSDHQARARFDAIRWRFLGRVEYGDTLTESEKLFTLPGGQIVRLPDWKGFRLPGFGGDWPRMEGLLSDNSWLWV